MVRTLDRNVKVWHLLVLGLLLGVLVGSGLTIAATATPATLYANGQVRLASAWSDSSVDITGTSGPDSLKRVLRTSIVVPPGKAADVQTSFSAQLYPLAGTYAYCFARFTVDSQTNLDPQFRPGQMMLIGGARANQPDEVAVTMVGFRRSIGPGTHHINVYVFSAYAGCELQQRSMNVVVNIH